MLRRMLDIRLRTRFFLSAAATVLLVAILTGVALLTLEDARLTLGTVVERTRTTALAQAALSAFRDGLAADAALAGAASPAKIAEALKEGGVARKASRASMETAVAEAAGEHAEAIRGALGILDGYEAEIARYAQARTDALTWRIERFGASAASLSTDATALIERFREVAPPAAAKLVEARDAVGRMSVAVLQHLMTGDPKLLRQATDAGDAALNIAGDAMLLLPDKAARQAAGGFQDALIAHSGIVTQMLDLDRKAIDQRSQKVQPLTEALVGALDGIGSSANRELASTSAEAASAAERATRRVALIAGLLAALVLAVGILLARSTSGPIQRLTGAMRALAAGDTGVVLRVRQGGEIGEMVAAVEVFRRGLAENEALRQAQESERRHHEELRRDQMRALADRIDASLGGVAQSVSSSARQLEASAQSMRGIASATSRRTVDAASTSDLATANTHHAADATRALSGATSEIRRLMVQASDMADGAVAETRKADRTIAALAETAGRIGTVVELIQSISSRTNLLALNASIEAARAGDAGRGFAIVASEVKQLAQQTATATDDIARQIAAIQASTGEAVEAIARTSGTMAEISASSSAITAAIAEQDQSAIAILSNVEQAAEGTRSVSISIGEIGDSAGRVDSAASEVLAASEALARGAAQLRADIDSCVREVRTA